MLCIPEHLNTWVSHKKIEDERLWLHSLFVANERPEENISPWHLAGGKWPQCCYSSWTWIIAVGTEPLVRPSRGFNTSRYIRTCNTLEKSQPDFDVFHLPWRSCPQLPNTGLETRPGWPKSCWTLLRGHKRIQGTWTYCRRRGRAFSLIQPCWFWSVNTFLCEELLLKPTKLSGRMIFGAKHNSAIGEAQGRGWASEKSIEQRSVTTGHTSSKSTNNLS